jgi:hypothetical protein
MNIDDGQNMYALIHQYLVSEARDSIDRICFLPTHHFFIYYNYTLHVSTSKGHLQVLRTHGTFTVSYEHSHFACLELLIVHIYTQEENKLNYLDLTITTNNNELNFGM